MDTNTKKPALLFVFDLDETLICCRNTNRAFPQHHGITDIGIKQVKSIEGAFGESTTEVRVGIYYGARLVKTLKHIVANNHYYGIVTHGGYCRDFIEEFLEEQLGMQPNQMPSIFCNRNIIDENYSPEFNNFFQKIKQQYAYPLELRSKALAIRSLLYERNKGANENCVYTDGSLKNIFLHPENIYLIDDDPENFRDFNIFGYTGIQAPGFGMNYNNYLDIVMEKIKNPNNKTYYQHKYLKYIEQYHKISPLKKFRQVITDALECYLDWLINTNNNKPFGINFTHSKKEQETVKVLLGEIKIPYSPYDLLQKIEEPSDRFKLFNLIINFLTNLRSSRHSPDYFILKNLLEHYGTHYFIGKIDLETNDFFLRKNELITLFKEIRGRSGSII